MVPLDWSVADLLGRLEGRPDLLDPADLARAVGECEILAPVLTSPGAFAAAFPGATVQAIHGDAPSHNVLQTAGGALDSDFELVCTGPVEWDLALCGPDVVDAYETVAARAVDRELVAVVEAARMVQLGPASRWCRSCRCWPTPCVRRWSTGARLRSPAGSPGSRGRVR